jgi:ATP-dependent RNA helicase DBP3
MTVLGRTASDDMTVTKNVTQRVEVLAHKGAPRFRSLVQLLTAALDENNKNKMIVFCAHKAQARTMGKDLRSRSVDNVVLEGDMSQTARVAAVASFRDDAARRVLVATDVAARGLDVPHVTHVFNYELGKLGLESYVHRCGRTGRAGRFGVAHTFVLKSDEKLSPELVGVLRKTDQRVPDELRIMAGKELKRRSKISGSSKEGGDSGSPNIKRAEEIADAVELRELREANREKQRRQNQNRSKKNKGGNNAKRGGRARK